MGFSVGFGVGPVRYSKRLTGGHKRRSAPKRRAPARRAPARRAPARAPRVQYAPTQYESYSSGVQPYVAHPVPMQQPGPYYPAPTQASSGTGWIKVIGALFAVSLFIMWIKVILLVAFVGGCAYVLWRVVRPTPAQPTQNVEAHKLGFLQARQDANLYLTPDDAAWLQAHR